MDIGKGDAVDNDIKKEVGKRIAVQRKLRDLKQCELGEMIGRSQSVISSWEKGIADPGSDGIILLAEVFGITPNDLLGFKPYDNTKQIVMPDDSMEPQIHKGDVLTVQTDVQAVDGDTVIVDTSKHKGIIRKLFRIGAQVMLLSVNPSVPPIGVHYADIKGKVTDIHRKL